jgi:hypothetical protein
MPALAAFALKGSCPASSCMPPNIPPRFADLAGRLLHACRLTLSLQRLEALIHEVEPDIYTPEFVAEEVRS